MYRQQPADWRAITNHNERRGFDSQRDVYGLTDPQAREQNREQAFTLVGRIPRACRWGWTTGAAGAADFPLTTTRQDTV